MKLEEFIEKNKENWDDKSAPEGLWSDIGEKLDNKQAFYNNNWFKISIVLLLIIVVLTLHLIILKTEDKATQNAPEDYLEYAAIQEFEETENYFLASINSTERLLSQYDMDSNLKRDLKQLDETYKELEQEFVNTQGIYKQEILRAMIQNHKTKLSILETVLYNYQNINEKNNEVLY